MPSCHPLGVFAVHISMVGLLLSGSALAQRRPAQPERRSEAAARAPRAWATVQVGDVVGHVLSVLEDEDASRSLRSSDLPAAANWLSHRPFTLPDWRAALQAQRGRLPIGICWRLDETSAVGLGLTGTSDLRTRERRLKRAADVVEFAYETGEQPMEMVLDTDPDGAAKTLDAFGPKPLPLGSLPYGTATLEHTAQHLRRHRHATGRSPDLEQAVAPPLPDGVLLRADGPGDPLQLRQLLLPAGTRCEGTWQIEIRVAAAGYRLLATADGETLVDVGFTLSDVRIAPHHRRPLAELHRQLAHRPDAGDSAPEESSTGSHTTRIEVRRDADSDKNDRDAFRLVLEDGSPQTPGELFVALVRRCADPAWWGQQPGESGATTPPSLPIAVIAPQLHTVYSDVADTVDAVADAGLDEIRFDRRKR